MTDKLRAVQLASHTWQHCKLAELSLLKRAWKGSWDLVPAAFQSTLPQVTYHVLKEGACNYVGAGAFGTVTW